MATGETEIPAVTLPLFPSHPTCTACTLHKGVGTQGHPGVPTIHLPTSLPPLLGNPIILFLGQNPGFHENKANQPFVGKSGQTLRQAIVKGLRLDTLASIYLTNTARCYTPDSTPPTLKQYSTCLSLHFPADLLSLLSLHPSKMAIVCLGAPATTSLYKFFTGRGLSLKSAFPLNGSPLTLPPSVGSAPSIAGAFTPDLRFFSTYHPAAAERDRNLIYAIADHMQLVADYLLSLSPSPSTPTLIPPSFPPEPPHAQVPVLDPPRP